MSKELIIRKSAELYLLKNSNIYSITLEDCENILKEIALEHTIEALEDSFKWYTPHPSLKEGFEDWKIQSLERHQKQLEQLKIK